LQNQYGCDSVVTLDLTVNPVYFFEIAESICEGETFEWQGEIYTEAGTYTTEFESEFSCDSIYQLELTVNPLPKVELGPDSTYCFGDEFTLMTSIGYSYYEWSNGTTGTNTITLDSTGYEIGSNEFYVIVTSTEGCENSDTLLIEIEICDNIVSIQNKMINIYPNPAKSTLYVDRQELTETFIINITTQDGKVIYTQQVKDLTNPIVINLEEYAKGIYYLQLKTKEQSRTEKIIIE